MRVNANSVLRSWTLLAAFGGSYAPGVTHAHAIITRDCNFATNLASNQVFTGKETLIYCIPRKYNVPLIITNLTSALNSLKFLVVNVLRYAHAHVKHVKNRYHKGTLKWQDL